jgi:ribosome-associated translation inhibitor RaiA
MNATTYMNPTTLNVQFRHMPKSYVIQELVQQQMNRLDRFNLNGGHCEVVIDEMHPSDKGGVFKVTLRLTAPGESLYVACAEEAIGDPEFLYSAIRMVFGEIELQIQKRRRKTNRYPAVNLAA